MHPAGDPSLPEAAGRSLRRRARLAGGFDEAFGHDPALAATVAALRSRRALPLSGLDAARALLADRTGPLYADGPDRAEAIRSLERELGLHQ
jgi:hypothetical protein